LEWKLTDGAISKIPLDEGIEAKRNFYGSKSHRQWSQNLGAESWQKTKTWSSKKNQNRPDLAQARKAEPTAHTKCEKLIPALNSK
jgi:hypothetical protein